MCKSSNKNNNSENALTKKKYKKLRTLLHSSSKNFNRKAGEYNGRNIGNNETKAIFRVLII